MQSNNYLIQTIDNLVQEAYQPNEPGAAVIVVRDGEVIFRKGQGMANLGLAVPIEPDMVFRLASITKQFTAVAILMLAERGKLSLDDSMSKFLPEYPTHDYLITIKHLLTHTSGSTGVSTYAINSRNQRRVTTNDGYLEPARLRANLTIQGSAHVDRVLFEEKRAVGVRVRIADEWQEIRAQEIILSAGAVHSPAILMRSGVGAPAALAGLGIDPVADLPVGANFQDHPIAGLVLQLKPPARARSPFDRHTNCCIRYTSGLAEAGPNDMMIVCLNLLGDSIGRHLSPTGELMQSEVEFEAPIGMIGVWVNRCFSRGALSLVSADPDIDPALEEKCSLMNGTCSACGTGWNGCSRLAGPRPSQPWSDAPPSWPR